MSKVAKREELFAHEYVIDLNGARAAIAVGIKEAGARVWASRTLTKPNVQALIAELIQKRASSLDITAGRVLGELAKLAFSNMQDYMDSQMDGLDFSKLTRDQAAAIQEITEDHTGGSGDGERKLVMRTKFKLADKGINLERLGRHLKLFTDRVEHTGLENLAELISERRRATE